jgi:hypothetical protein
MKKFSLLLAVLAVLALLSVTAPSTEAHGRRVFVASNVYGTTFVSPVVPIYRPRVIVRTAAYPVFVPVRSNLIAAPVVLIPPGPFGGYNTVPVTYYGW